MSTRKFNGTYVSHIIFLMDRSVLEYFPANIKGFSYKVISAATPQICMSVLLQHHLTQHILFIINILQCSFYNPEIVFTDNITHPYI